MRYTSIPARAGCCFVLLLVLVSAGCSGKKTVSVEGKVTFADGKALPTGTRVIFEPSQGDLKSVMVTTDESGSFKASVEVGKYTIRLAGPAEDKGEFKKLVPEDYAKGDVLSAEVKEGMSPLDFKVKTGK